MRFELRDVPGAFKELVLLDLDAAGMTFLVVPFVHGEERGVRWHPLPVFFRKY